MKERTDVGFVGNGNTKKIFEGKLLAWTPNPIKDPVQWYESFRTACLESIGKRYQPVYRMADGEFQFLVGRRLDWSRQSLVRELAGVLMDRFVQRPTIWGEVYCRSELAKRRAELVEQIKFISREGQLALFLYDNGIRACETYFKPIVRFLESHQVALTAHNYVPFHFPVSILVSRGWQEFVAGRRILIVSSLDSCQRENAAHRLKQVGSREVNFVSVSKTNALRECLDLGTIERSPDLCLVAAGIGASNILKQLKPLSTLCLDIGSYIHCIEGSAKDSHGGVFHFPKENI